MGEQRGHRPRALERRGASKALVEHAAQRVDVRPGVSALVADLLRRGVVDGAGEVRRDAGIGVSVAGEPEVGQVAVLPPALLRDEDVGGLDVAVDEPVRMRAGQGLRDLIAKVDGPRRLERRLACKQSGEVLTVDVPHRYPQLAVRLAGRIDRDDVRVIEGRGMLRLGQEPLPEARVGGELLRDELQRDAALQPEVLGEVDDAHTSTSDDRLEPVTGEIGADTSVCRHACHGTLPFSLRLRRVTKGASSTVHGKAQDPGRRQVLAKRAPSRR